MIWPPLTIESAGKKGSYVSWELLGMKVLCTYVFAQLTGEEYKMPLLLSGHCQMPGTFYDHLKDPKRDSNNWDSEMDFVLIIS